MKDMAGQAETFFIASCHPTKRADVSHRGGPPGFVRVLDRSVVCFPDFAGNNMFQTLGNLIVNPRAGLLFIDFETSHTLRLTGGASVRTEGRFVGWPDAQRPVIFAVEEVFETGRTV